ncbi:MAG: TrkA family potassium uptake protein [SAR202 cluster bacterium]|nr:TrkA family potassium uptake protein [SAR202 cluster bacterium]
MKKQVTVVGLGRFGSRIARTLYQLGHDVMAIDQDEARVQQMMGEVTYAVRGDATNEAVLRELGVHNFDVAIVAIGTNVQASIMVSVLLKTMGIPYIVSRANNELHGNTLERIGCNKVVYPEMEMGVRLAHGLFNPNVQEHMEITPSFGISRIAVPDKYTGMALAEAGLAGKGDRNGLLVVALKRGDEVTLSPDPDEKLLVGDILVVVGWDNLVSKITTT